MARWRSPLSPNHLALMQPYRKRGTLSDNVRFFIIAYFILSVNTDGLVEGPGSKKKVGVVYGTGQKENEKSIDDRK